MVGKLYYDTGETQLPPYNTHIYAQVDFVMIEYVFSSTKVLRVIKTDNEELEIEADKVLRIIAL